MRDICGTNGVGPDSAKIPCYRESTLARVNTDLDLLSHPAGGHKADPPRQRAASQGRALHQRESFFASRVS